MFGRYELLDRIGLGGMAEVWRARVTGVGGFEKILVIKKILPSFASNKTFIDMLLAEARLCAMLQHANIVQTYENGEIDGAYYIAMEYVQGFDLFKILSKSTQIGLRIPAELCLYIAAEVAKGLHYAHTAKDHYGRSLNIIHRDVSPSNVIISQQGEVKVMDFGVARATPGGQPSDQMTRSGVLKGKLGYMSPEQVTGKPFDHRSDVFSLGIILYESLTLKRLFLAKTDLETLVNIRDAKIEHKFQKHSYIEEDIRVVLRRALAKDPDERYPTAMAMHDDIIRMLFERKIHVTSSMLQGFLSDLFAQEGSSPMLLPPPMLPQGQIRTDAGVPDPGSHPAGPIALSGGPETAQAVAAHQQSGHPAPGLQPSGPTPATGVAAAQAVQAPRAPAAPVANNTAQQPQRAPAPQQGNPHGAHGPAQPRDTAPQPAWEAARQAEAQRAAQLDTPSRSADTVPRPGINPSLSFSHDDLRRMRERVNQKFAEAGGEPVPALQPAHGPSGIMAAEPPSGMRDTRQLPRVEAGLRNGEVSRPSQPLPITSRGAVNPPLAQRAPTPRSEAPLPAWPVSSPGNRVPEVVTAWPTSSPSNSWPGSSPSQRGLDRADTQPSSWANQGPRDTQPMRPPSPSSLVSPFSSPGSRHTGPIRTEPTHPDVEMSVPQGMRDRASQPAFSHQAEPGSYTVAVPGKGTPPPVYRLRTADGQEFGPLTQANLEAMLRARTASPEDMVSFGGMPFQPIRTVAALQAAVTAATPTQHQPPTMQGNLNQWVFVRLVYRLFADRATGMLELRRGDAVKSLYFRRGRIQYVASNQAGELLGPFMVANGFISQTDIDMAIARSKATGGRLGDLLIGLNLIKPHQLVQVLEKQLRAKLIDAFGWDQGTYAFYDSIDPPADIVTLDVDPIEVLVEGVRDRVPLAAIEPMLADKLDRPLYPMRSPLITIASLKFGARETKALTLLQNASTPRAAYEQCYTNRPQRLALLQVIMLLLQTDLVTFDAERAAS